MRKVGLLGQEVVVCLSTGKFTDSRTATPHLGQAGN